MKKFLATIAMTALAATSVNAATILVGTDAGYAPYEYKDPQTNEIVGFDIDLIKAIAKATGNEAKIQNMQFASQDSKYAICRHYPRLAKQHD